MSKSPRRIKGLLYVKALDGWPRVIPKPCLLPRTKKGQGITYERKLAEHLRTLDGPFKGAEVLHGQWMCFRDAVGGGLAQPDIILIPKKGPLFLIEAKLTYKSAAEAKLRHFYAPLVRKLMRRRKLKLICATKNLTPAARVHPIITDLAEAITAPQDYFIYQWRN